ncbi:uncharacterized protein B0H18DRAFT_1081562 [Fomitopsis serialis]|uniref:uncharacterized protein n=1 Tax=Fomitopsis serialis TaxID=139415 RepID=UPI002007A5CE|nr:uncharacterized protein B0H18DRAFT_1081562 [Neoantrodia serialis]KAH9937350.1 hypothetical protein B0H18DRAFT_1081562 [Neoantrodia serialis]
MARKVLGAFSVSVLPAIVAAQASGTLPTAYTLSGAFPTSVYAAYYNDPTATTAEPQPVISDPVTHEVFPYWLTNPETIPQLDTYEAHPLPPPAAGSQLLQYAIQQISTIANSSVFAGDSCAACLAGLEVAKFLALAAPEQGPNLAVALCEAFDYSDDCATEYGVYTLGTPITQVIAYADVGGYDGQVICQRYFSSCPDPGTSPLDLTNWFAKPKPNPLPPPKQPTGERLKVLHMSDLHIDPRYMIGAEANCTDYLCCRPGVYNSHSPNAVPVLTGTEEYGFNFTIYTGDLVSHDPEQELSRDYDHLASLWEIEGWLSAETAQQARTHYSAYSVQPPSAEDAGDRGTCQNFLRCRPSSHDCRRISMDPWPRPTGWDGTNALKNREPLVDRYSPHVIAASSLIYYANNATDIISWIMPSVTPLTNLNSGFRMYEVDSGTFEVLDSYTWYADVNSFGALDGQTEFGPTYQLEYSAREAYGRASTMEANSTLVQLFNTYQGKSSVQSPACTGECIPAKICYMRSGSASIAATNCPSGYGSVQ